MAHAKTPCTLDMFSTDEELVAAEAAARRQRRGLWADERPVEPRQWRDAHPRNGGG